MPSLAQAKIVNADTASRFKTRPVLVVFGGTAGIGSGIVRAFANHTHGNIHIVVLGRNAAAAAQLFDSLPKSTDSLYEFLPVDAVLMRNVAAATNELRSNTSGHLRAPLTKINYLVLSQGAALIGHPKTEEGLEPITALALYGRARAALELQPLLEDARKVGEDGRVLSIGKAGSGGPVDLDDLPLARTGLLKMRGAVITYKDAFALEYAARFPNISTTHADPGFVITNLKSNAPWFLRWPITIAESFAGVKPEDCGEWMMYGLTRADAATGAHFISGHGDKLGPSPYADESTRKVLWNHIVESSGGQILS